MSWPCYNWTGTRTAGKERNLKKFIRKRQPLLLGHIMRKEGLESLAITGKIEGKRSRGRQRRNYLERSSERSPETGPILALSTIFYLLSNRFWLRWKHINTCWLIVRWCGTSISMKEPHQTSFCYIACIFAMTYSQFYSTMTSQWCA